MSTGHNSKIANVFDVIDRSIVRGKGLRGMYLSGHLLEMIDDDGSRLIKNALPKDVAIVDYAGSPLNFVVNFSTTPMDRYYIVLCSSAWPTLQEGIRIPEIQAIFSHKDNQRDGEIICELRDVEMISESDNLISLKESLLNINTKFHLNHLLNTILSPTTSSSSVIQLAQSIKDDLDKEK